MPQPSIRAFSALLMVCGSFSAEGLQSLSASFTFTCAVFPANLSEGDLIARHGSQNVQRAPVFGSDDGPENGTVLFQEATDARVELVWENEESRTGLRRAEAVGSAWTTASGIRLGMDLLAVERANRGPFRLAGYDPRRTSIF